MEDFLPEKEHISVSPGESVGIVREMQELTQARLAALAGMPRSQLLAIENGLLPLTSDVAAVLARALHVIPAVLILPPADMAVPRYIV